MSGHEILHADAFIKELLTHEPKPVECFVPDDSIGQRDLFLAGTVVNPRHTYSKLATIDFAGRETALRTLSEKTRWVPTITGKTEPVYRDLIGRYRMVNELMWVASLLPGCADADRSELEARYTALNESLYGGLNNATYQALLTEKIQVIESAQPTGRAGQIYNELTGMVAVDRSAAKDAYSPPAEVVSYMQAVVTELFGDLLDYLPKDGDAFTAQQVADVFNEILASGFGEAAEGWRAAVTNARTVNVVASEKLIKIPEGQKPITLKALKSLAVHELGVHVFRAIRGGETDLLPMEVGLAGYYDSEEGLGVAMEQALEGKYKPRGGDHYITAGLMTEGRDFRQTFEVKWRLAALTAYAKGTPITDGFIEDTRVKAYGSVMRIARGAGRPWLKDLAYHNGSVEVWRFFEQHVWPESPGMDGEIMLNLALLGKIDPTQPPHLRAALETRTP